MVKTEKSRLFSELKENFLIKQIALAGFIYISLEILAVILSVVYFLTGMPFLSFFADYGAGSGSFIISLVLTIIYYLLHNILTWSKGFRHLRYNFKYVFSVVLIFLVFGSYLVVMGGNLLGNLGSSHPNDFEREGAILLFSLAGFFIFSLLAIIASELIVAWAFRKLKRK